MKKIAPLFLLAIPLCSLAQDTIGPPLANQSAIYYANYNSKVQYLTYRQDSIAGIDTCGNVTNDTLTAPQAGQTLAYNENYQARLYYQAYLSTFNRCKGSPLDLNDSTWMLKGNTGTNWRVNFIGPTDTAYAFVARVGNRQSLFIDTVDHLLAVGYKAGYNIDPYAISGDVAVGWRTLMNDVSGSNTAVGNRAMSANTSGSSSCAFGYAAMLNNTSGYNNTAMGIEALLNNTTGFDNTAVGAAALANQTTGAHTNVAIGANALTNNLIGDANTAVGTNALEYATGTGDVNNLQVAMGYQTLMQNLGSGNTAIGGQALQSDTPGQGNTACGYNAAEFYNGSNSVIIGAQTIINSHSLRDGILDIGSPAADSLIYGDFVHDTIVLNGHVKLKDVQGIGPLPGIAAGVGAGTSPTIAIVGTTLGGIISVTTGSTPSTGAVVTITFANSFAFPTTCAVTLTPREVHSATAVATIYATGTTTGFSIDNVTVPLTAATTYQWNYTVVGLK